MRKFYFYGSILGLFIINAGADTQDLIVSGHLDVADGKLYYETCGNGDETIIFIHDGLVHGDVWDGQFSIFAEKYRVIRYDRPAVCQIHPEYHFTCSILAT
jgi:hypothetical protein